MSFVSFFPQLVAGPIERAKNLLPQFTKSRSFDYDQSVDGLRQVLWGIFKKVVIADGCAVYVNEIFNVYSSCSSGVLILGAFLFSFQIYCDFSGYSDMAIGFSKLLGFKLMRNFNFPYFSRDVAEFWRRWHISLSSWFKDYLYIPMGGNRGAKWRQARNLFVIFVVSGVWHGANWTVVRWGFVNACYVYFLTLMKLNRKHLDTVTSVGNIPNISTVIAILTTFALTTFTWIIFRSPTIEGAFGYITSIFTNTSIKSIIDVPTHLIVWIGFFIYVEWMQRSKHHGLDIRSFKFPKVVRWLIYNFLIISVLWYGGSKQLYIYFQF